MKASTITEHFPLTRLAFRPLFLLGALFSILAMLAWLAFWHGNLWITPYGGMLWWHQHEMLFGFGSAIITGFLLTAVQNWTGRPSLSGAPLLGIVLVWLSARVMLAYPSNLPDTLIMLLDVAFLPLVGLVMARLVIAAKLWRNLIFVPVLLLLAGANIAMHLGVSDGNGVLVRDASHLTVLLTVLLMVVMGGRVIPFFTARKLGVQQASPPRIVETGSLLSMAAVVFVQLLSMLNVMHADKLMTVLVLVAGVANAWRLAYWKGIRTWREPLLWGLHLSYGFIAVGLVLWAWQLASGARVEAALHALAIGSMGTMMLAMMARVSLGHTGRMIRTLPGIGIALSMLVVAALARSVWLILYPATSHWVYSLAILLWCTAFLIFVAHYSVPLLSPRSDGKPG
ncbi:NnrS family protein [Halomonas sp. LS-001]